MEKSIQNAFTYMFKDNEWTYKLFILMMLYLPGAYYSSITTGLNVEAIKSNINFNAVIIGIVVSAISVTISTGYLAKCTHNIIKNEGEAFRMPCWEDDFFSYFFIGIKKGFAIFITSLLLLPTIILLAIPLLIFSFIFLALDNIFCVDFKLDAYFAWKKAFSIIVSNNKLYYIILFLGFILSLVPSVFYLIKLPTIIFSLLFAACMTYTALVYAYLIGIVNRDGED